MHHKLLATLKYGCNHVHKRLFSTTIFRDCMGIFHWNYLANQSYSIKNIFAVSRPIPQQQQRKQSINNEYKVSYRNSLQSLYQKNKNKILQLVFFQVCWCFCIAYQKYIMTTSTYVISFHFCFSWQKSNFSAHNMLYPCDAVGFLST